MRANCMHHAVDVQGHSLYDDNRVASPRGARDCSSVAQNSLAPGLPL